MLLSARSKGADAAKVLAQEMQMEARRGIEDNDTLEDLVAWVARAAAHDEALEAHMAALEGQLSCPILRRSVCCCRDSYRHHHSSPDLGGILFRVYCCGSSQLLLFKN